MTFLVPLGLIGLLGIVALIIIYIIRPNYQQRIVSSTFVWKLSLKYRKKKIPISKLRNIIIIILQILILTALAFILAKPALVLKEQTDVTEVIAILDASASMRTEADEVTRFERAVGRIKDLADDTIGKSGTVSVIFADDSPYFLSYRNNAETKEQLKTSLEELLHDDTACTYGNSDVNEAIAICDEIIRDNPGVKIYLYTDKQYDYAPSGVSVVDVSEGDEWNAAVVNAYAEIQDNAYVFTMELGVYGKDEEIDLAIDVYGANASKTEPYGTTLTYKTTVECFEDKVMTVAFKFDDGSFTDDMESEEFKLVPLDYGDRAYTFDYAIIALDVEDSFIVDNNFSIYGGKKENVKVLYASPMRNSFVSAMLDIYTHKTDDDLDVEYNAPLMPPSGNVNAYQEALETSGYDLYIYEHVMPKKLPTDGVVVLIDPDTAPQGADFNISGSHTVPGLRSLPLVSESESHPLTNKINFNDITVSKYARVNNIGGSYEILATCDGNPVVFARKDENLQTLVVAFSEHFSNNAIKLYFPMLFINLFGYYFPDVTSADCVEVYGSIDVNARGDVAYVTGYEFDREITEFPAKVKFDVPGSYTVSQTTYFDKEMLNNVFVRIPAEECNVTARGETFDAPYFVIDESDYFRDLLLFIEIALVALLFAEWAMHIYEGI